MRKHFTLYCVDEKAGKGEWQFTQIKNGMNVTDPSGRVVCWFSHANANDLFALPSFWRSIKHITFKTDKGLDVRFEPDRKDVLTVWQYLDDALLHDGVEGLKRFRNQALLCIAGGAGAIVVSLVVVFLLDQFLMVGDPQPRRYTRPVLVVAILGLGVLAWGVYSLFRYARLFRRWKEQAADIEAGKEVS
jgi:hypothetical protein